MTRTDESLGGLCRRARMSSADALLPSAKTAFMISRSRRVRCSALRERCDMCRILPATFVACQAKNFPAGTGFLRYSPGCRHDQTKDPCPHRCRARPRVRLACTASAGDSGAGTEDTHAARVYAAVSGSRIEDVQC